MNDYNFICKLDSKLKQTLIKNPHTIQFFCNISNIIENKNNKNINGYYYNKTFTPPLHKKNILKKEFLKKKYKKEKLPIELNDIPYITDYIPRKQKPTTTTHWGQMKLFLVTLYFLNNYVPKNKKTNILYAGSAPGHSIPLLVDMFPNTYWYLVDPAPREPFDKRLYKLDRVVQIKKEFMTDKLAKEMKNELNKNYFLFISDIRTEDTKTKRPSNKEIIYNNEQQMNWHKILKPKYSYLKYKLPYYGKNYKYFDGKIILQPFAPNTSTETRMIIKNNSKIINYNIQEYEGKLSLFNYTYRASYYKHNFNIPYMDHCFDCTFTYFILKDYISKHNNKYTKMSMIKLLEYIVKEINTTNKLKTDKEKLLKKLKF